MSAAHHIQVAARETEALAVKLQDLRVGARTGVPVTLADLEHLSRIANFVAAELILAENNLPAVPQRDRRSAGVPQ